jgi:hypothetical protein
LLTDMFAKQDKTKDYLALFQESAKKLKEYQGF